MCVFVCVCARVYALVQYFYVFFCPVSIKISLFYHTPDVVFLLMDVLLLYIRPLTDQLYNFCVMRETQYIIYFMSIIIIICKDQMRPYYLRVPPMVLGGKYSRSLGQDM